MRDPLLALSHELSELRDRETYLQAARVSLAALLPGDDIFWLETDFVRHRATARHGPSGDTDPRFGDLLAGAVDHPLILSYLQDPGDLSPRRLSDVDTDLAWRNSRARDVLGPTMGRRQLSLVVRLELPGRGHGWTFGRAGRDFTDAELELAGAALPLMTALDRLYARCPPAPGAAALEAGNRVSLTPRELDVLTLVAEGLTAVAIGHLRRIGSTTVRKHLEHVYAKLDCHDRLMAVQEARRLGVLPPLDFV